MHLTPILIALLVLVAAMPPLGNSAYLPGLPLAANEFAVSTGAIQLTLTVYIAGTALGQILIGPVSDRLGRRGPLLAGIAVFVFLNAAIAFAPTLQTMLILRLLQGVAAGAGAVLGRAIVADMAPYKHGAASGILGSAQAVLGASAPPIVGILGVNAMPMALTVAVGSLLGVLATQAAPRFAR